ncbi:hypothetical protein ACFY1U_44065 [Streptomyces sp. NPDC001351]
MKTQAITWNAVVPGEFDKTVAFFEDTFGLTPGIEVPGFVMFPQANGGI